MITPEFTPAEALLRAYDLKVYEPLKRLRLVRRRPFGFLCRHFVPCVYPGSPRYLVFWPALRLAYRVPVDSRHWRQPLARLQIWAYPDRPRWAAMQRKVSQRMITRIHQGQAARMPVGYRPQNPQNLGR